MNRRIATIIVAACGLVFVLAVVLRGPDQQRARPDRSQSDRDVSGVEAVAAPNEETPTPSGAQSAVAAGRNLTSPVVYARTKRGNRPDLRHAGIRRRRVDRLENFARSEKAAAWARAAKEGWASRWTEGRAFCELMAIRNGKPYVYTTLNEKAAISTAADLVRLTAPYDVDGSGTRVGIWDGGAVRASHREMTGRVTVEDNVSVLWHSTHVAGTVGASGVTSNAMGMAPAVSLSSYDWGSDTAEMTGAGSVLPGETNTLRISNHSYGVISGWNWDSENVRWRWYGTWGDAESDNFGTYDVTVSDWDEVCELLPYFLPFKSAGNDRNDGPPPVGISYQYYSGGWQSKTYTGTNDPPHDGWDNGGYDTIPLAGGAKNIVTVGSVSDAYSGGARSVSAAAMSTYSGWGPTDDGRIKPDIVGNGENLYSADSDSDSDYTTASGTSMASPNVAGSAALLVDLYEKAFSNGTMRSSTLKGLVLHTADDKGNPGPDYKFGWGLMNTERAAELILAHATVPGAGLITEDEVTLTNSVNTHSLFSDGTLPIRVTVCWTDPAAAPLSGLDNPELRLVNDLDLRVVGPGGITNFPYVLDPANPSSNAFAGDNFRDNVEQVWIEEPVTTGMYSVVIGADGTLQTSGQVYSVVMSGATYPPVITHVPPENTSETGLPYNVEASIASLAGHAAGSPVFLWNTDGSTAFLTNTMVNVTGTTWRAQVPAQPIGTAIHYCFHATATNGLAAVAPALAPAELYRFDVTQPLSLEVTAQPELLGTVTPSYATHTIPSGNVVNAEASLYAVAGADYRYANVGWTGAGDVPASGATHEVSFEMTSTSTLTWQWQLQYALMHTSTVTGLFQTNTWWENGSTGQSVTASSSLPLGGTNYAFAGWALDGVRQPDPTNAAINPVGPIAMSTSHVVLATYVPEDLDSDGDDLDDWWEIFFFGNTDADPMVDSDGDGYLNVEEYQDRSDPRDVDSVPGPPSLLHVPLDDPQSGPAPWTVTATITDNYEIARATLSWQRNGLAWREADMTETTTNVFEGTIPEPGILGDTFVYRIEARDHLGYRVEGETNSFFVAYPILEVAPTNVEVLLLAGSATNLGLSLGNDGNTNLVWALDTPTVGFEDGIESGSGGWSHGGENDAWNVSSNRAFSAPYSWYSGLDSSHEYQNYMLAHLDTEPILLAGDSMLTFMHWMSSELSSETVTWDGGRVEISSDGGETFSLVFPEGGYPHTIRGHADSPWPSLSPAYGGTGGWASAEFDLSGYAGDEVIIRFVFGSDGLQVEEGWYIDDVAVSPYSTTNVWLLMTPTNGVLVPSGSTNVSVTIDTSGLASGTDSALVLRLLSNDPVRPLEGIETLLRVRSLPVPELTAVAQTSTNGSGFVTIEALVYDADGEDQSVELFVLSDDSTNWFSPQLDDVDTSLGSASVSNNGPYRVLGVATETGGVAASNSIQATWSTTNGASPISGLSTNTLVRLRLWDGLFWSEPATSQPFFVDNEVPGLPTNLVSLSHVADAWSTNPVLNAAWGAASDGEGIGVAGYALVLTNAELPVPGQWIQTTGLTGTATAPQDATNLWLGVRAIDAFGNAGPALHAGTYRIDTTPPSPSGAVVTAVTSDLGDYVMGNPTVEWSGFVDEMSGISNYFLSYSDGGGTTGGQLEVTSPGILSGGVADQTNRVYVWAMDRVGLIGLAAFGDVLILDPAGDFDRDGVSSWDEEFTGTDASDANSVFGLTARAVQAGSNTWDMVLEWGSLTGRSYAVYRRPFLVGTNWGPSPITNLPGIGGPMSYTDRLDSASQHFYRLGVEEN